MKIFTTAILLFTFVGFSADLTTNSGKTYKNYSVAKVSDNGIQIMHSAGICTVPFEELPDAVREKYRVEEKRLAHDQVKKAIQKKKRDQQNAMKEYRTKMLQNIIYLTNFDLRIIKVLDRKSCVVCEDRSFNEFIVTDIDTSNIADGGILPYLDTFYLNQTHSFSACFQKINGKLVLYRVAPDRGYNVECSNCGLPAPKISDKSKLAIALYNLQKTQCPKNVRMRKRHRLYYVGTRTFRNRKYMVFTVNENVALKFAKWHPVARIPKMKEPPSETIILRDPPMPRTTGAVKAVDANSTEALMLQSRRF